MDGIRAVVWYDGRIDPRQGKSKSGAQAREEATPSVESLPRQWAIDRIFPFSRVRT